jgi:hypothetical protein
MPLPGNTALHLRSNFLRAAPLERVGASAGDECASNRDEKRAGFHPLILESRLLIAN